MPTHWAHESCDRRDDPESGARIIQLTGSAAISNNIYCEEPYGSPDGTRVAITRAVDFSFGETYELLVHDLSRLRLARVGRISSASRGVCCSPWSGLIHYWTEQGELKRVNIETLEEETLYIEEDPKAARPCMSVSPDQRYLVGPGRRMTGPGSPTFQVVRLDVECGKTEVIFEDPEICNPHLQFNRGGGPLDILVQNNRGLRMAPDGSVDYKHATQGTTLFAIDANGGNQRFLPLGPPVTETATGHECFVADTGRVLFSVSWDKTSWAFDGRYPAGNLFTAKPGDAEPTPFVAPDHRFNHVSASRCGRYFVADSHGDRGLFVDGEIRSCAVVVGNLETGQYRVLVAESGASGGGSQYTHVHPYLTADNGHVIFNANPCYSVPQVFAARIPDGFLASLD